MNDSDAIDDLLRRHRIVTVAGPSGCGKSYAAQFLAPEITPRFAGGGRIIDLHDVETVAELLAALALALDMPPPPRTLEGALSYIEIRLQARAPTLFVLDGLDQLLPRGRGALALLMHSAPHSRFLLTAHRPLGLRNEAVHFMGFESLTHILARGPNLIHLSA